MTAPALYEIPYPTQDPLRQSVTSLALFAMQAAGADGYSWSERDEPRGVMVPPYSSGFSVPRWERGEVPAGIVARDGVAVVSYPMGAGLLVFVFRRETVPEEHLAILDRMAAVIEAVYAIPHTTAQLAARIGKLDAELAGIKIAERTRGYLANGDRNGETVDAVVQHVETVMQARPFAAALEQLLPELEDRLDERRAVVRAKALLQRVHGMTEEQAYLHLRYRSRSTRRRLREVAQEFIEGRRPILT
jgi:hypothetical protein